MTNCRHRSCPAQMMILILIIAMTPLNHLHAQTSKPRAVVEKISYTYRAKDVKARKLTVSSEIPIPIALAWTNVKTPALLQFVAKGMIRFKAEGAPFPRQWQQGQTYGARMRIFGFIPFGGVHHLYIEEIDDRQYVISTREWDRQAKVWNHRVSMQALSTEKISYEDEIIIYGGWMTPFITAFAKKFYKHRQRRWQIVAREGLDFGTLH